MTSPETYDDGLQRESRSPSPWVDLVGLIPPKGEPLSYLERRDTEQLPPTAPCPSASSRDTDHCRTPKPVTPVFGRSNPVTSRVEGKLDRDDGNSASSARHVPYKRVPSIRRVPSIESRPVREANVRPSLRFRRAAKAISIIVKVCGICKSVALDSVVNEEWYALIDSFTETPEGNTEHVKKRGLPFVTFETNEDLEVKEIAFDKSAYSREFRADYLITDDIRETLRIKASLRTPEHINEIVRFLKQLSNSFRGYPLDVQKDMVRHMYYDKYHSNRVIVRKGLMADGIYFVLSGTLLHKTQENTELEILKPGECFGEEDLICGRSRQATVITENVVELLSLHRLDYRRIMNMADVSNSHTALDICSRDIVFTHFPIYILRDNPGVWTVLSYKFGRLMAKDSNDVDWIYVIMSGEARVIKQLMTRTVDLKSRRRKQERLREQERQQRRTKLINFVSDSDSCLKSTYGEGKYEPARAPRAMSAPSMGRDEGRPIRPTSSHRPTVAWEIRNENVVESTTKVNRRPTSALPVIGERVSKAATQFSKPRRPQSSISASKYRGSTTSLQQNDECPKSQRSDTRRMRRRAFICTSTPKCSRQGTRQSSECVPVPHFVHLETLLAGQVFGIRSCLNLEERGPSASLVSDGCQVLQINRKFFRLHADNNVVSIIRMKYAPFPSEEDLLDRLTVNMQWAEYRQKVLETSLKQLRAKTAGRGQLRY